MQYGIDIIIIICYVRCTSISFNNHFLSFYQLRRLIELKEFCVELGAVSPNFKFREEACQSIEEILPAVELLSEAMVQLQGQSVTLSDMFGIFLKLIFRLKESATSIFVTKLIECIEKREKKIFESPVTLASIFLDSRLRLLLTVEQITEAKKQLQNLFVKVYPESNTFNNFENSANESTSSFEEHLSELEAHDASTVSAMRIFQTEIENFGKLPREPLSTSITDIWYRLKIQFPSLYTISEIIMSASPTEVCVERNFSRLKFAMNRLRSSLKDDELEKILLISLNRDNNQ